MGGMVDKLKGNRKEEMDKENHDNVNHQRVASTHQHKQQQQQRQDDEETLHDENEDEESQDDEWTGEHLTQQRHEDLETQQKHERSKDDEWFAQQQAQEGHGESKAFQTKQHPAKEARRIHVLLAEKVVNGMHRHEVADSLTRTKKDLAMQKSRLRLRKIALTVSQNDLGIEQPLTVPPEEGYEVLTEFVENMSRTAYLPSEEEWQVKSDWFKALALILLVAEEALPILGKGEVLKLSPVCIGIAIRFAVHTDSTLFSISLLLDLIDKEQHLTHLEELCDFVFAVSRPYRIQVRFIKLTPTSWERLLNGVAKNPEIWTYEYVSRGLADSCWTLDDIQEALMFFLSKFALKAAGACFRLAEEAVFRASLRTTSKNGANLKTRELARLRLTQAEQLVSQCVWKENDELAARRDFFMNEVETYHKKTNSLEALEVLSRMKKKSLVHYVQTLNFGKFEIDCTQVDVAGGKTILSEIVHLDEVNGKKFIAILRERSPLTSLSLDEQLLNAAMTLDHVWVLETLVPQDPKRQAEILLSRIHLCSSEMAKAVVRSGFVELKEALKVLTKEESGLDALLPTQLIQAKVENDGLEKVLELVPEMLREHDSKIFGKWCVTGLWDHLATLPTILIDAALDVKAYRALVGMVEMLQQKFNNVTLEGVLGTGCDIVKLQQIVQEGLAPENIFARLVSQAVCDLNIEFMKALGRLDENLVGDAFLVAREGLPEVIEPFLKNNAVDLDGLKTFLEVLFGAPKPRPPSAETKRKTLQALALNMEQAVPWFIQKYCLMGELRPSDLNRLLAQLGDPAVVTRVWRQRDNAYSVLVRDAIRNGKFPSNKYCAALVDWELAVEGTSYEEHKFGRGREYLEKVNSKQCNHCGTPLYGARETICYFTPIRRSVHFAHRECMNKLHWSISKLQAGIRSKLVRRRTEIQATLGQTHKRVEERRKSLWAPLLSVSERVFELELVTLSEKPPSWDEMLLATNSILNEEHSTFHKESEFLNAASSMAGTEIGDFESPLTTVLRKGMPRNKKETGTDDQQVVLFLSSYALKWFHTVKDAHMVTIAERKLLELAKQLHHKRMSYANGKRMTRCKEQIFEAKLDAAQRILLTWMPYRNGQRSVFVWFIAKHDNVSSCLASIERTYTRMTWPEDRDEKDDCPFDNDVVLDPNGNTPLRVYQVKLENVKKLLTWTPPLRLTQAEREIVETVGSVTVLGRSGSGKTFCVTSRMAFDCEMNPKLKQVFVARTRRLCKYVESILARANATGKALFVTITELIMRLENILGVTDSRYDDFPSLVTFRRFKENIWKDALKREEKAARRNDEIGQLVANPLTVWTQIRTHIKGSVKALTEGRPLTLFEYANFGMRECSLSTKQREFVYRIYLRYKAVCEQNHYWDQCDRVAAVFQALKTAKRASPFVDQVYVDEVQDMTQGELALLTATVGFNPNALFFVGDTAQSISHGVDFRFAEIRSMVHVVCGNEATIPKPMVLRQNYRTHDGILKMAGSVIEKMLEYFPNACDKLPKEKGFACGPRPEVFQITNKTQLVTLLRCTGRATYIMLPLDEVDQRHYRSSPGIKNESEMLVQQTCESEKITAPLILDVIKSKGLEFSDVVIFNFFGDIPDTHQNTWKRIFSNDNQGDVLSEVEREMKLLYTAITRACNRLLFVETKQSKAGTAFVRHVLNEGLASKFILPVGIEERILTRDERRFLGIQLAAASSTSSMDEDDDPVPNLQKAIELFQLCEEESLLRIAQAQLQFHAIESTPNENRVKICVQVALECIKLGMTDWALEAINRAPPSWQQARLKSILTKHTTTNQTKA